MHKQKLFILKVIGKYNAGEGIENLEGLKVILSQGKKQLELIEEEKNFVFELEPDGEYLLTFERNGYISKKLSFITKNVPKLFWNAFQDAIEFAVTLGKQPINELVMYEQPIAVITYNKELDGFLYTVNYAKTAKQKVVEKKDLKGE
jgi:hypothetical protein